MKGFDCIEIDLAHAHVILVYSNQKVLFLLFLFHSIFAHIIVSGGNISHRLVVPDGLLNKPIFIIEIHSSHIL